MKILVIGPSWIGDMMMSHSLYRTLKTNNPKTIIDVIAPNWCKPLISRMPEVRKALTMPLNHGILNLKERWRLSQRLRTSCYDQALVLPGSFKSALIPFLASIPRRTGWRGEMRYGLLNDIRILNHTNFPLMVHRYIALGYEKKNIHSINDLPKPLCLPRLTVSDKEKKTTLNTFNIDYKRPIISLCPGTAHGLAKCWPFYHYAELTKHLINLGYQILLLGSTNEKYTGIVILQGIPKKNRKYCCNFIGKTNLEEAVILISCSHAIISNDSGLMHIAAALNQPLIALYGPSDPGFTPPLSKNARVIHLMSNKDKIKTNDIHAGYHPSLIKITPEKVITELKILNLI
ncbi:lipopolysaccharide heptosyltransferase II [Candidatus Erwinia haradaeae]|uniref:lipopolysaccharide heptosyltransferase II n=1 Tax=Candidatus Erwinia haradaeae TaxID=1922217 RepID=A0A451D8Q2_9GAMM|nr:lipopolysaccharide heptosyltransferase II [Candidatus Erwinia haradaeae]VFP82198.1 ADP-heptose--LPS heptosyltransferase 2 [Candidatus Erwinia haradaeae]